MFEAPNGTGLDLDKPTCASDEQILRAHAPAMLARLDTPEDFDADTPHFKNIAGLARASVAAALDALKLARAGENVFSLMRPPGHHALREKSMGFCYLNNIAIAVLEAAGTGAKRVAVFDFDVHHGNGTEDILLNRPGIEFFSVHQNPAYPDTGAENRGRNCFNYPVGPGAPRLTYRAKLAHALDDLRCFRRISSRCRPVSTPTCATRWRTARCWRRIFTGSARCCAR